MAAQSAPTESLDRIPLATVRRWAMKAAFVGFCLGMVAAIAALQAG
jgi:outer membrane biosynthesis protein TonB